MFAARILPRRLCRPAQTTLRQTRTLTLPQPTPRRPPPFHKSPHPSREELHATKRRQTFLTIGAVTSMITLYVLAIQSPQHSLDSLPHPPIQPGAPVILITDEEKRAGVELVPSGTTSVPGFPKHLEIGDQKYTLIGLGIRTVSFLGIQVYVVGLYVSTSDLPTLSTHLLQYVAPSGATSTTVSERDSLRTLLLSPEDSERIFTALLQNSHISTALRIVPTRNTDFSHLRDGWIRSITARARQGGVYEDPGWTTALDEFRRLFGGRGSVPKKKTLLLVRDGEGKLTCWYDPEGRGDGKLGGETVKLGDIKDYRVGLALWLGYLAGGKVASVPARESVVEGLVELVGRPVGSVV
ncbi:chalcone-flavanone isomerase-domain-containing protein [Tuber borchii]|uniref:Chalcone-flavanone isomerase-domain-containing protein n=1 Tax=Tuber borchii TaxID=42251 RepID=A0A2T6ZNK5_TUBBO|nr:chalcone-flavanone isomerase-domain-containing protein [Tuber borchii]